MNNYLLKIDSESINAPTWEHVHHAILRIGAETANTVILQALDEELPWFTLGGHRNHRYSATVELRPVEAFVLTDPSEPVEYVEVTFPFGEWNMESRRDLVSLSMVIQAAKYYFEVGQPDPSLVWRKSPS